MKWCKAHGDQARERSKEWYKAHRDQARERRKEWYKAHGEQAKKRNKERSKARDARGRAFLNEAKGRPCTDCHKQYSPWVMQFDHLPGTKKLFAVGHATSRPLSSLLDEIAKCEVVCANCHAERTHQRRLDAKNLRSNNTSIERYSGGTQEDKQKVGRLS